nr:MAG TPA: hypothetical protein [Caudoviricetes sp.]
MPTHDTSTRTQQSRSRRNWSYPEHQQQRLSGCARKGAAARRTDRTESRSPGIASAIPTHIITTGDDNP